MQKKYENLHAHTTASDGELGYKQVLDICAKNYWHGRKNAKTKKVKY